MVNHLSFQDDTIEAKKPATKPRYKKYTKTKRVKKEKPVSPKKTWWKKNSIYQLLCCQNTCYSFALYFTLAVFIALFVYAVWKICDLRLSSKSQHPNKRPQGNKNNVINASNITHRVVSIGDSRLDPNTVNSFKNINKKTLQTTERPLTRVGNANRHKSTLKVVISPTKNPMTMNNDWLRNSLQVTPFNSLENKRYMIPPSPSHFSDFLNDQFAGSGENSLEEWRAMRLALLQNRLKLTTGSSMPTENPYWKAWFQSRLNPADPYSNPFWKKPTFTPGNYGSISAVHDNTFVGQTSKTTTPPATQGRKISKNSTKEIIKHSDIAGLDPNSTFARAYTKLLQDLVNKIHILRDIPVASMNKTAVVSNNNTAMKSNNSSSLIPPYTTNNAASAKNSPVLIRNANSILDRNNASNDSISSRVTTTRVTTKTVAPTTSTTTVGGIRKHTTATAANDREMQNSKSGTRNKKEQRKHKKKQHLMSRRAHHKHKKRTIKKHKVSNSYEKSQIRKSKAHSSNTYSMQSNELENSGSGDNADGESGSGKSSDASGDEDRESGFEDGEERSARKHGDSRKKSSKPYIGLRQRLKELHKKNKEKHRQHHSKKSSLQHTKTKKHERIKHHKNANHGKFRKKHQSSTKEHGHKKHAASKKGSKSKKISKKRKKKLTAHSNKHKFMNIVQQKLKRVRKKNQIAHHLSKLQKKLAELMKKKKKRSHHKKDDFKRKKKTTVDGPKVLQMTRKERRAPKKWHVGKAKVKDCAIIKHFVKNHYVGIDLYKRKHGRNTYAVTECSLKHGSHRRYKCRRSFYRTTGYMNLKSVKKNKKSELYLVICRHKSGLSHALVENVNKIKKAKITFKHRETDGDSENSKRSNLPHHRRSSGLSHRNHAIKSKRHHRKSHLKNLLSKLRAKHASKHKNKHEGEHKGKQRKQRSKHTNKHHRRHHLKRMHNHRHKKRHHKKLRKHKEFEDEDDDAYESGSAEGDQEASGDIEKRFERSASSTKSLHSRTKHGKKHKKVDKKGSKKGFRNGSKEEAHRNITRNANDGRNKMYEEFFDMMKEMKDVMKTNSGINLMKETNTTKIANVSNAFNMSSTDRNFTAVNATGKGPSQRPNDPTSKSTTKVHERMNTSSSMGNAKLVNIQEMVAQIVPAVMQQMEKKSVPSVPLASTTKSPANKVKSSTPSTTTRPSTLSSSRRSTTAKPTVAKASEKHPTPHPRTSHVKVPTTSTAQGHHTSARHTSPRVTPHHRTPHRTTHAPTHRPTTIKHLVKATPTSNIAMILKGLKALGLGPIVQHATTRNPQPQKKSVIPSKPQTQTPRKQRPPTGVAATARKQLPVPIPKPMPLHNPYQIHLLCFGDSLTAGYHNHGKAFSPYGNHLGQLINLSSRIPASVEIKGIVGEMTHKQMVSRLPEVLGNSSMFDWVIILGGTNDILHVKNFADDQEFLSQLESVWQPRITKDIEKLHTISQNYGAHTMLLTIPENAIEWWPGYKILLKMRTKINIALRQFASQHRDKIALCDIAQKLPRHSLSEQQEALFWDDHLHMTQYGYNKMAEEVYKCLRPYLPK